MGADLTSATGQLVMVIDDDDDIRSALSDVLEQEGYRVVAVGDGREGLRHLTERELPQLILLDLMMPNLNGWQFRAEQLMNPVLASVPVIVITAAAPSGGVSDLGVEVIAKPFDTERLMATVRRVCARPGPNHAP